MRRSVHGLGSALVVTLPLVACSLLVDTAGLSGDATASRDAASDTPPDDGRATDDGAADAASDALAKCVDGPNRFCDGFDDPMPGLKWTGTSKTRGAITFEDVGLSPPRAMHAALSAGGGSAEAKLLEELAGNPPNARCELDMKLDNVVTTGETDVLAFVTQLAGKEAHNVYFASFDGVWKLAEYADSTGGGAPVDRTTSLGATLPNATWFHVVVDVTATVATVTANGTFTRLDALSTPAGDRHLFGVGVTYTTANVLSGGVFIDNVDCTMSP